MAFGKRMRPPEIACDKQVCETADAAANAMAEAGQATEVFEEKVSDHRSTGAADPTSAADPAVQERAAQEFLDVLVEAFQIWTPSERRVVDRSAAVSVAAAVLGQMAARMVFSARTLNSMPATLAEGAANGAIFADAGRNRDTIYQLLLIPARGRLPSERLPDPHIVARRINSIGGLSIAREKLPRVNALTVMGIYDAIAMKIAQRANFDRTQSMRMTALCLAKLLQGEKDDDNLAVLILLSLEMMLHASRINPNKRD